MVKHYLSAIKTNQVTVTYYLTLHTTLQSSNLVYQVVYIFLNPQIFSIYVYCLRYVLST